MTHTKEKVTADLTVELLRDILIVQLAKSDVPQLEIRKLVGCDIHRVSRIAKVLKKAAKSTGGAN